MLTIKYHIYVWQVSPHLTNINVILRGTFTRSKILLTQKLTNGALVTPTPGVAVFDQFYQDSGRKSACVLQFSVSMCYVVIEQMSSKNKIYYDAIFLICCYFFKMWSFAVVRFLCFFMCDCAMCFEYQLFLAYVAWSQRTNRQEIEHFRPFNCQSMIPLTHQDRTQSA